MVFELDAVDVGDGQGQPVDPPGLARPAVLAQPGAGEPCDAAELLAVDRVERPAVALRAARLDLAEDHDVGLAGDEVELAPAVAPVPLEDLHPVAPQVGGGEPLAETPQLVRADLADVHGASPAGRGRSRTCPEPKSRSGSR
ncbi:MAG TPA: hypothetical protein VFU12_00710 [Glycomyces sp.]|nr:hypothetical protein [Glycomyces sp.]